MVMGHFFRMVCKYMYEKVEVFCLSFSLSVCLSASCVYTGIVQITFGSEDTPQFSNKCDNVYSQKLKSMSVCLYIHL